MKPRTPKDTDLIFTASQWLPTPLEETFAFFAEARNLERITPPFLSFRIVTPGLIEMYPGALIDYQLRVRGFPIGWQTEITAWDPPNGFTDVQLRGPYQKVGAPPRFPFRKRRDSGGRYSQLSGTGRRTD